MENNTMTKCVQTTKRDSVLQWALRYANLGWSVLPVSKSTKCPVITDWPKRASCWHETIKKYFSKPELNIGVACEKSEIIVLDIDKNRNGFENWKKLINKYKIDDRTLTNLTGNGGMHLIFKCPSNFDPPRTSHNGLGPGIELLSKGSFIMLPPSIHPNGNSYKWDNWEDKSNNIMPFPRILYDLIEDHRRGYEVLEYSESKVKELLRPCIKNMFCQNIKEGERNIVCFIIASELLNSNIPCSAAHSILDNWNSRNNIRLPDREIVSTVNSAYACKCRYGCNNDKLSLYCKGKRSCKHFKTNAKNKRDESLIDDFSCKGWPKYLSDGANLIYSIAIPKLERSRGVGIGGVIFVSHNEIRKIIGRKSASRIGEQLEELRFYKLIKYKTGDPDGKKHIASEISRIIPIPPARKNDIYYGN
jgi:hypothetical protein